jgi:hypothetical protein
MNRPTGESNRSEGVVPVSWLPGGAADKLSNLFEVRWTAYRLAEVLVGRASRMRLEPPGDAGEDIESEITESAEVWCEQVKDAASAGRWTPHRLVTAGVLRPIRRHLIDGKKVRLVLSTDAEELTTLTLREYMSDNEVLRAPIAVLAAASVREVAALESDGVLVRDADGVGFFHETYFDFLFAQAFTASGRDLVEFLLGSGQYLFRRAQARPIPEFLSAADAVRIFEDVAGAPFAVENVPVAELREQYDAASDSLSRSIAALMISCGTGTPLDPGLATATIPLARRTTVRDYALRVSQRPDHG